VETRVFADPQRKRWISYSPFLLLFLLSTIEVNKHAFNET